MKHNINELYRIVGDDKHIYTAKAVEFVNHSTKQEIGNCYPLHHRLKSDTFRIYDEIGSKAFRVVYQYGERAWFDTAEERAEYRAQVAAEAAAKREKKQKTLNIWKSPYTGELFAIPADFIPAREGWELIESVIK
jgi:hypothetical protein